VAEIIPMNRNRPPSDDGFDSPALGQLISMKIGDKGPDVVALKLRLTKFGLLGLDASDTYDKVTATVVGLLQAAIKRPANGVYDSFLDSALGQAEGQGTSMPSNVFTEAVAAWNSRFKVKSQPVQVVEDVPVPFYRKPAFWLFAGGGFVALTLLLTKREKGPSFLPPTNTEPLGGDDPDAFFNDAPPAPRRPKRKKRRRALAAPPPEEMEEIEGEDAGSDEPEIVDEGADAEAKDVNALPEKPKKRRAKAKAKAAAESPAPKKRRRKARALAESAAAPPGEERGEDTGEDIEEDVGD
jgi:hypothetical protein